MKSIVETNPITRDLLNLEYHFPNGAVLMLVAPPQKCWLFKVRISAEAELLAAPFPGRVDIVLCAEGKILSRCSSAETAKNIARNIERHVASIQKGKVEPAVSALRRAITALAKKRYR